MGTQQSDSVRPRRFIIHTFLDTEKTVSGHTVWLPRNQVQLVWDTIAEMRSELSVSVDELVCGLALGTDAANLDGLKQAVGLLCATSAWDKNELPDGGNRSKRPRDKFRKALEAIVEVGPLYRNNLRRDLEVLISDLVTQAQSVQSMLVPSLPRQVAKWHSSSFFLQENLIAIEKSITFYETSAKCSDGMTILKNLLQLSGLGSHGGDAITKAVKDPPTEIDRFVEDTRYTRIA